MNAEQMNAALYPTKDACSGIACMNCMTRRDDLVGCTACMHARYCGKSCQKVDWKARHKPVCKNLQAFRALIQTVPPRSEGRPFAPGTLGLLQKFESFQSMPLHAMMQMSTEKTKKSCKVIEQYLYSARCCSVCQTTQYDVPLGESKDWINCTRCKYGWCCSREHWAEYESRHTREICDLYNEACSVELFRFNHVRSHGDTFLHLPRTVLSEPMDPLPRNWKEYFEMRCSDDYAMKALLPKEFFPAATHSLSQTATIMYGMYSLDETFFTQADSLTIHVVGAAPAFEMLGGAPNCVWEEIMHCLPAVKKMHVVFVGPEVSNCFADPSDKLDNAISCCPDCVRKSRSRLFSFVAKTYHDYANASKHFTKPDFVAAFNTGMFEEPDTSSWKPSLDIILDMDVPSIFTSYNKFEAEGDCKILREVGARMTTEGPVLNPFSVDYHTVDPSEVDGFFKSSMYCICFRGRTEA